MSLVYHQHQISTILLLCSLIICKLWSQPPTRSPSVQNIVVYTGEHVFLTLSQVHLHNGRATDDFLPLTGEYLPRRYFRRMARRTTFTALELLKAGLSTSITTFIPDLPRNFPLLSSDLTFLGTFSSYELISDARFFLSSVVERYSLSTLLEGLFWVPGLSSS